MPNLAFLTDPGLRDGLQSRLQRVESRLTEAVKSDYPFVTQTSAHLVEAGGKRFRPLMTLLCAAFGDPEAEEVYDAATVVELTHLATLYHDDVMDEAPMRRGRPSANSRWDNSVAILTGDFLFSRASDILADLGPEAVRIQARTFERLVTGQIRETVGPAHGEDPVAHHLQVLADKTGSLIATSAQFGAMFAGCDQAVVDTLTRYGERIGVAFQLADDLVDLTSDPVDSGKTPGTDLREGVPTLAGLIVLRGGAAHDAHLADLLTRPLDDAEVAEALPLLRAHDAVAQARIVARQWADDARDCLLTLPEGAPRDALASVCDYVVDRTG
ncbi:MAG: polyprenyl synthetase family protein [Candidatus Nanopelagicales bacterium]|nr:polyprenyl synthetase family protein [Candidatus Nanopelagicales bacterium]